MCISAAFVWQSKGTQFCIKQHMYSRIVRPPSCDYLLVDCVRAVCGDVNTCYGGALIDMCVCVCMPFKNLARNEQPIGEHRASLYTKCNRTGLRYASTHMRLPEICYNITWLMVECVRAHSLAAN